MRGRRGDAGFRTTAWARGKWVLPRCAGLLFEFQFSSPSQNAFPLHVRFLHPAPRHAVVGASPLCHRGPRLAARAVSGWDRKDPCGDGRTCRAVRRECGPRGPGPPSFRAKRGGGAAGLRVRRFWANAGGDQAGRGDRHDRGRDTSRLPDPGDGGGVRCDHGKADDDGCREVPAVAGGAPAHRAGLPGDVQLSLFAAALTGEGAADERRDWRGAVGGFSLAAQHAPWRGLFPALAQQEGKLGRPVCAQIHPSFRFGELVARRDAGGGDGDGQARILYGSDGTADGADGPARALPHLSGEGEVRFRARSGGESVAEVALSRSGKPRRVFPRPLRVSRRQRHRGHDERAGDLRHGGDAELFAECL